MPAHHPSWTAGGDRRFFAALGELPKPVECGYDQVAAFCEAFGFLRPSQMPEEHRRMLLEGLSDPIRREKFDEWVAIHGEAVAAELKAKRAAVRETERRLKAETAAVTITPSTPDDVFPENSDAEVVTRPSVVLAARLTDWAATNHLSADLAQELVEAGAGQPVPATTALLRAAVALLVEAGAAVDPTMRWWLDCAATMVVGMVLGLRGRLPQGPAGGPRGG